MSKVCARYCARLWDVKVNETLSQPIRLKGYCKEALMPLAEVWIYRNVLETGGWGDIQKRFPGGSCSELSLEGRRVVFLPPIT